MNGHTLILAKTGDMCTQNSPCWPVQRWADTIGGLTSRVDDLDKFNPLTWFKAVPSNIEGIFLNLGNNLWGAAAWIESQATSSLDGVAATFGKMANRFIAAVWSSLSDWYILAIAIIFTVGISLWQYVHNGTLQAFGQRMVALVLGLALFAGMGIASANHPDEAYTGTPYWLVEETSNVIGTAGGAAADAIVQGFGDSGVFLAYSNTNSNTGDLLSCRTYLNQLHEEAKAAQKSNGAVADTVLSAMNTMWEETGLRIWARAQYGAGDNGMQVFCRIPEYRSGATASAMKSITQDAIKTAGGGEANELSSLALAFNPSAWNPDTDGGKDSTTNTDIVLDRWMVMWDVCGYGKYRNSVYVRDGWQWVNSIRGENRGIDSNGKKTSGVTDLPQQCAAALTGSPSLKTWNATSESTPVDTNATTTANPLLVDQSASKENTDYTTPDDRKALINKFNIKTDSSWEDVARTHSGINEAKDSAKAEAALNASVQTLSQQHGEVALGDLGGAIVFSISAIINLLIWGIGFGLIKMFTLAIACLVAAGGLWLGLLFYAFSPDKGKRAVVNATKHVVGMTAAGTVLGLVASTGCLFVTSGMSALGLLSNKGNTAGTVMMMAVASAALPIIYLWAVRYICVNVWKIGDPFSGEGLFKMIGGQALMGGLKSLGGMAVGGAAGAIGAAMGGAGLKGMLGAAAHGAGLDRMPGAVGRAVGTAAHAKERAEYRRAMGLDGDRPKRAGSEADQAAVDRDDDGAPSEADASKDADQAAVDKGKGLFGDESPSDDERSKAEKAVRDRYRRELEAKGLKGDDLESALDARMRSAQGLQAVDELADRLHSDAGISDEDRASARKAVYHKRAAELEKAGFKGESLKRELDRYMDSDKAKEQIDKLAGDRYERRVYGDDMKRATEAMRGRLRDKYAAQGLTGDGLERAVNAAMKTDATLARIRENTFGSHAANLLDGLSGNLSGERREAIAAADHAAAYDPTEAEMRQATDEFRQSITDDETRRLQASHPGLEAGSDEFRTMLAANVDHRMRGAGEDIRNRARQLHHDAYMQRMSERVRSLDPNARSLFDQRMNAECDRLMGANPNLSIAEVQARARENLLTESNMNDIERQGVRHAIAGMNASVNGNDTDILAAARTLGIEAGADRLDDATDTVRARFARQAASDGLTGVALERRVDGMMSSDMGRQAVQAQALRMDPQVAAQAAMARGEAVDRATVQLMRTGAYGDTAGARAAAIAQNRLTGEYAAQGLSGKELDARTVSSTGPVEQKPYGSVRLVDIDTDRPATPTPTVSLEPRPDLPPSFAPDTTPRRNLPEPTPSAARRIGRHYDAAMRRSMREGRLDDVDAAYGTGVAAVMDATGLVSPDVAARVTAGENLLPQNRDGYTPQYVADTATYGGENAAGTPVGFRAVGASAGERLDAMAGTDMTASTVAAFTQATDADAHVARHFTKHPQASLNRMGVNVRDEQESVRVLGALNGLNRERGAEGVARAAKAIQASGGTDAAGALDAIERAGRPAPAKPAAAPASDPWAADPGSYDGMFDDFADRARESLNGRKHGTSYAKGRADAARRGGDGSQTPRVDIDPA